MKLHLPAINPESKLNGRLSKGDEEKNGVRGRGKSQSNNRIGPANEEGILLVSLAKKEGGCGSQK